MGDELIKTHAFKLFGALSGELDLEGLAQGPKSFLPAFLQTYLPAFLQTYLASTSLRRRQFDPVKTALIFTPSRKHLSLATATQFLRRGV